MKKALIIILLFIAGCAGVKQYSPDFHTGIKGLTLEFLENAPPNELLDVEDNQFLVGIGLKNEGAWDVTRCNKCYIKISSFKNYINLIKGKGCNIENNIAKCSLPRLYGKGFSFAEGEFYPLYLDAELNSDAIKKEGSGLKEVLDTVTVEASYEYGTTASVDICVNDVREIFEQKKSCTAKTEMLSGQGAPVAVTQIEYTTTKVRDVEEGEQGVNKNRINFIISFEDKGSVEEGIVDDEIVLEEISFSDYSTKGDKKIICNGVKDNKIIIKKKSTGENENKVICQADIDRVPAYSTPLIIKFNYGYTTVKKKIVKVKRDIEEIKRELEEMRKKEEEKKPAEIPTVPPPIEFVPAIPTNEREVKEVIIAKSKLKPRPAGKSTEYYGDFRNFFIYKENFPNFKNPGTEEIRNIINNYVSKIANKDSTTQKVTDCFMKVLYRESTYLQFRDNGDKWELVASNVPEGAESSEANGCCIGISQIFINQQLNDFKAPDSVNSAYEWITNPIKNVEKGTDMFLNNIKRADGDLDLAYGYFFGSGKKYGVCSGSLDRNEKWWVPLA